MGLFFLIFGLLASHASASSVSIKNAKTCESLGFSGAETCTVVRGFSGLKSYEEPRGSNRPNSMIYVAVLDENEFSAGSDEIFQLSTTTTDISISPKVSSTGILNRVQIYNYPGENVPRFVRLNGELLRRGHIHYHRDLKMLELLELNIPLDQTTHLTLSRNDRAGDQIECAVSYNQRNPDYSIPQSACFSPCTWDGSNCWMPDFTSYGYVVAGAATNTSASITIPLRKFGSALYGMAVDNIAVDITILTENSVRIRFYDPVNQRYEVPININNAPPERAISTNEFDVIYPEQEGSVFFLRIVRKSTGTVIFDTSISGITFEDQLLSLAIRLPSRNVYGLGESYHPTFRRELDDSTWPLWARDEPPNPFAKTSLYGTHPYYSVIEADGNAHGVLLYNSNAQEYILQSGAPAVVFRTIGGVLDLYVMTGPKPEDVTRQYTSLVGRSFLPPYWSFGFQLSRYGYNNLQNMKDAIARTKSCNIPIDVFYGDIDTMDQQADFTIDPVNFVGLPEYVDEQRALGMRYVPIIDPAIPGNRAGYDTYERGLRADAYITTAEGNILFGNVWPPEPVAFPDFFRTGTLNWWIDEITRFYQVLRFDGLWIDMNEPSNFNTNIPDPEGDYTLSCPASIYDDPPYVPKAGRLGPTDRLNDKTICLTTTQGDNGIFRHYDVHNLYGYSETIPTSRALQSATNRRGLVFTRSSFVGSGILGGHWTGDNYGYWDHMQYSVVGLLDFNIFGLPYVGADICGFFGDSEERLCERWQELGAFYPFSRNHNTIGTLDQDPCTWPATVGESTRKAMNIRYTLLPFFYTSFYRANQGIDGTVIRSLAWEFTSDQETWNIDRQFLWRDSLLVSPALDIGALTVTAYFPAGNWFDYYTGEKITSIGQYMLLDAPYDFIPLHVRSGRILPTQEPANNTVFSRQNAFGLIVALDATRNAVGDLFWDDGESIDTVAGGTYHYSTLNFAQDTLTQTVDHAYPAALQGLLLDKIEVLGNNGQVPTGVTGDISIDASIAYDPTYDKVILTGAAIPMGLPFSITFTY
ncbi:maltase-glucoamylase-like [Neocloeon triangulifer]|uniref:maltase-glucoamylase-like n=1 Tax=Neocloeon triangulifer TaxID=2078957 RepID=UPI00286F60FE|nr:maltase-glucoamylase-like [Neocloeon triangulifer]